MPAPAEAEGPRVQPTEERIGLVLAGGGARGAYEVGALTVLLPELAARDERVSVIVGTSVGALNGAWLAANIHRPVEQLIDRYAELWRGLHWEDVLSPLCSPHTLAPIVRYLVGALGGAARVESLLDSSPLAVTVERRLDTHQMKTNLRSGLLHAVAVVATSAASGRSVVFHAGGKRVRADNFRGIDYAPVELTAAHVRASAAIPGAFRAVRVETPEGVRGWYLDGGTRLNTPIKPALALGAGRVIVVALNSARAPARARTEDRCPDVFQGIGHITQAVLADPMAHDVRTLATINSLAQDRDEGHHRLVPYILVAPKVRDRIGEIAREVFREHYAGRRAISTSVGALGSLVRARDADANGELLSYLFFAPEFAEALLAEGAADARAWLRARHDDGLWQHAPLRS